MVDYIDVKTQFWSFLHEKENTETTTQTVTRTDRTNAVPFYNMSASQTWSSRGQVRQGRPLLVLSHPHRDGDFCRWPVLLAQHVFRQGRWCWSALATVHCRPAGQISLTTTTLHPVRKQCLQIRFLSRHRSLTGMGKIVKLCVCVCVCVCVRACVRACVCVICFDCVLFLSLH